MITQNQSNLVRLPGPFSGQRFALLAVAAVGVAIIPALADTFFTPGDLVVTRSVYTGTASTITVGQTLPGGGTATANGSYPGVWANETPDPSFGVTSPIYLDQLTTSGSLDSSLNITSTLLANSLNLSTSFPSKSELAINLSGDGTALTFMAYTAAPNLLDVSNSNTPGVTDPTNPVSLTYQRAVAQVNFNGSIQVTPVNAYSGNNGRAAVLAGGNYYMVGNAGNSGSGTTGATLGALSDNTGVQMTTPGGSANTLVVGKVNGTSGSTTGYQRGFSIASVNSNSPDKTGKDDNFRGLTVYNNTLYVTKGSGGNGINTVYQVGTAGSLPSSSNAGTTSITVLPGFTTTLAKSTTTPPAHPFGLWFADANTLYVADEGTGNSADINTAKNAAAGLEKWVKNAGTWSLAYTLTSGLNLGTQYSVANGPNGEVFPTAMNPATDGLRNITGKVNGDGTVTIYGVTSTVSTATDQGADPNKLVAITDTLTAHTLPGSESFTTLKTAGYGEVLRGVAFAPTPEPGETAMAAGVVCLAGFVVRRLVKSGKPTA